MPRTHVLYEGDTTLLAFEVPGDNQGQYDTYLDVLDALRASRLKPWRAGSPAFCVFDRYFRLNDTLTVCADNEPVDGRLFIRIAPGYNQTSSPYSQSLFFTRPEGMKWFNQPGAGVVYLSPESDIEGALRHWRAEAEAQGFQAGALLMDADQSYCLLAHREQQVGMVLVALRKPYGWFVTLMDSHHLPLALRESEENLAPPNWR